jgi:hypothetical protein
LLRRFASGGVFGISAFLSEPMGYLGTAMALNTRVVPNVTFNSPVRLAPEARNPAVPSVHPLMTGVPVGGTFNIYATDGTSLVRLYQDSTAAISSTIRSALWQLQDPIRDKQALKFAVRYLGSSIVKRFSARMG